MNVTVPMAKRKTGYKVPTRTTDASDSGIDPIINDGNDPTVDPDGGTNRPVLPGQEITSSQGKACIAQPNSQFTASGIDVENIGDIPQNPNSQMGDGVSHTKRNFLWKQMRNTNQPLLLP